MARPGRDRAIKLVAGTVAGVAAVPATGKYIDPQPWAPVLMNQPVSTLLGIGGGVLGLAAVGSDRIKDGDTADAALVLSMGLLTNGILKWSAILEPTPAAGLRIRRAAPAAPRAGAAFM